jgi:Fe-S cluster biogenesis protein NfuA
MFTPTMNEPTLAGDAPESDSAVATAEAPAVDVDMDALLETIEYIRPALQADGGDLVLLGVDGGTVNLQMVGACGGCPMSMMTLKAGIERIMFDRVAGVTEVNAI